MDIPFAINSYLSRSRPISQQRLVNGYVEKTQEGAKSQIPVFNTPGIKAWTTVGDGPIRGAAVFKGKIYVVSGTELYAVDSGGLSSLVGDIPGAERCTMAVGNFLVIQTETFAYYTGGAGTLPVADPDFQGASSVAWLGGYYIYPKPNTDVFYVSQAEAPSDIDAFDYASAEAMPDNIVTSIVDHNDLILFGDQVTEIWALRGGTFPFIRLQNGVLEYGCAAKHSPAKLDNSVFWLSNDKSVRVLRDNIPQRVSTDVMDTAFEGYGKIDDAIGISMVIDGRATYTLIFPTEGKTWQFSVNTGLWNELESYNIGRWRVDGYINYQGKHLVWDATTNRLGELDKDVYTEWGEQVVWTATSAPVVNGNKWLFHNSLYLDFETGDTSVVDAVTGDDRGAALMIRWSDDAKNWGPAYQRYLGRVGEYSERVSINQSLGRAKNRVYEISISDPVRRRFIAAEGDISPGGY